MIAHADLLLRGAAIGANLILALRIATLRPVRPAGAALFLLAICLSAYLLASDPKLPAPQGAWIALAVLAGFNPFLVWFCGLAIFDDRARPRPWHLAPLLLTTAPSWIEGLGPLRAAAVAALYLHLLAVAARSARGDLVEARIRFRPVFLAAAALFGLAVTATEIGLTGGAAEETLLLLQALTLASLSGAALHWSHRLREALLPEAAPAPPPPAPAAALSPAEAALLARLEAAMAAEVWREEGLTIGALATRLGAPEHRLRKAINRGLGWRNFSAFVNAARIEAAKRALAEPARAETPVLSLAYESGFASLGPFNRAFREATGMSPTEFREAARRK